MANSEEVVISGISGRYPESDNLDQFWSNLLSGVELGTEDDRRWPVDHNGLPTRAAKLMNIHKFDADFFNIAKYEANELDPQIRILLETTAEALMDAGFSVEELRGTKTGVYMGRCHNDTLTAQREDDITPPSMIQCSSIRISHAFDLHGPAVSVDTACASSFSAFDLAIKAVKSNQCDMAIVNGVGINLNPFVATQFQNLQMISQDGRCKCLDGNANGYCRSEAIVSIIIQKKSAAKRVYATVLNVKTNTDGYKVEGITFPRMSAQYDLMRETYAEAGVDPNKLRYMEAHVTGTQAGDPVECEAIFKAMCHDRKEPLLMGCLKSNMGHSEGASGLCAVTKACLAFQRGELPPNLHFKTNNPKIEGLRTGALQPVNKRMKFDEDLIGLNSFGFGGVNVHTIFKANEKRQPKERPLPQQIPHLITIAGRMQPGLEFSFDYINKNRDLVTPEFFALLASAMKGHPTNGLNYRGYGLFDWNTNSLLTPQITEAKEKRPLWLVFDGISAKEPTTCKALMKFESFAKSIAKSASILATLGLDLMHLLDTTNSNQQNMTISIVFNTAFSIAMYELLAAIKLKPDGITGYSVGEIAAAYADGAITQEEALYTAFYIGHTLNSQARTACAMFNTDLTWEDAWRRAPSNVYIATHEAEQSVSIAGLEEDVQLFVKQLRDENRMVEEMKTCDPALHTPIIRSYRDFLLTYLRTVITEPRARSSRWYSSSVPEHQWPCARVSRFANADYFVNMALSQVHFEQIMKHIPKNAAVVYVGKKSPLLAALETGLGADANVIRTTKEFKSNAKVATNLLNAIGQIYNTGHAIDVSYLYDRIDWPVARETLSISPMIQWNHTADWKVRKFPDHFVFVKRMVLNIDLIAPEFKYLTGHCIDGRILFPATGYLWAVWDSLALSEGLNDYTRTNIEFKEVKFHRATILNRSGNTQLNINWNADTGYFQVCESGAVCVNGLVKLVSKNEGSTVEYEQLCRSEVVTSSNLEQKEIYRELRVRGYDYGPSFQGLVEAATNGTSGKVKWLGNWVAFTDAMLQLSIFGNGLRGLFLPTYVEYVKCDIDALLEEVKAKKSGSNESILDVYQSRDMKLGTSKGLVVKGMQASSAPRRQTQQPTLESYEFVPYDEALVYDSKTDIELSEYELLCEKLLSTIVQDSSNNVSLELLARYTENAEDKYSLLRLLHEVSNYESNGVSRLDFLKEKLLERSSQLSHDILLSTSWTYERFLRPQVDVAIENMTGKDIKFVEVNATGRTITDYVKTIAEGIILPEYSLYCTSPETVQSSVPARDLSSKHSLTDISADLMLVMDKTTGFNTNADPDEIYSYVLESSNSIKEGGFLLLLTRSSTTKIENKIAQLQGLTFGLSTKEELIKMAKSADYTLISEKTLANNTALLFRKNLLSNNFITKSINVLVENYEWIEEVKTCLIENRELNRVWLVANDTRNNGVVGLVKCLRKEQGSEKVRCIFFRDEQISSKDEIHSEIIAKDLVMNVIEDGKHGSFRHLSVDSLDRQKPTEHAFLDVKTKGDMSSFRWYQIPGNVVAQSDRERYDVYCAALNFKDVMVASGRISTDAYPKCDAYATLGMEFAGKDSNGNRVMGFCDSGSLASTIFLKNSSLMWSVPDNWSLADAATVPVVYFTVYYALFERARMQPGESVLIHAGSGGVGQAAISVCLSLGCNVFTTVGSQEKRNYLLRTFPALKESQIGNSRDLTFEEMVLKETNGRGVDIVLNSLSEDKLKASVRCLCDTGSFVEIGKYDITQNNALDFSQFGHKQFHVVCVAHLTHDAIHNKTPSAIQICNRVRKIMDKGIVSGEVRPLRYDMFDKDQCEEAFRFMASGKHVGKVLIKMRHEETRLPSIAKPLSLMSIKRTAFNGRKSYIITGGLGGFGIEIANWIVERGGRNLVLSSRTGVRNNYHTFTIDRLKSQGVNVVVSTENIATRDGCLQMIEQAEKLGPVGGYFHLAMVLKDAALENQNVETFETCCSAKVNGCMYFDELSRKLCPELDHFVCFSSVSTGRGNAGQTNYGFANSVMERTCDTRRRDGLPGLSIQWGVVGDVGVVAEAAGANEVVIGGTVTQRLPSCLDAMDCFMQSNFSVCSSAVRADTKRAAGSKDGLLRQICHVLGAKDPSSLSPETTLNSLGLDSLMAVEVKQLLERDYEISLTTQEIRVMTVTQIKEFEANAKEKKTTTNDDNDLIDENDERFKFSLELPTETFVILNSSQEAMGGRPIFFVPPVEGDFSFLNGLTKPFNRPLIGLNWTKQLDQFEDVKSVAKYYIERLREEYHDIQYDLIGYSLGGVIAFEMATQLQATYGDNLVIKLILLDSSPDYVKAVTSRLSEKYTNATNFEAEVHADWLIGFASLLNQKLSPEVHDTLKESLISLPTNEARSQYMAASLSQYDVNIDSSIISNNADRYFKKSTMVHFYKPERQYFGDIVLARATETGYNKGSAIEVEEDYGLSKVVSGKIDVKILEGDHKSFISNHKKEVIDIIETHFQYFGLA